MIVFLAFVAYIIVACAVGRLAFNMMIIPHYEKQLKSIDASDRSFHSRYYGRESDEEIAYAQAKLHSDVDVASFFIGCWWPISAWYLVMRQVKGKSFVILPSKPQKEIRTIQENQAKAESLKQTIKLAKAAGIDTKELEQIERSYRTEAQN